MANDAPSSSREHLAVAREAGYGRFSPIAVVAGTLCGFGAFAILAAIMGAILSKADVNTNFRTNDWTSASAASGLATAVALFLAYLFGGYVAGRMARRAGLMHGIATFVLALVIAGVAGGLVAGLSDKSGRKDLKRNLRSIGIPSTPSQWGKVGITAGILALALMLVGAVLGGLWGERWHTKLARRAVDPEYGPEADARRQVVDADNERDRLLASDEAMRRDAEAARAERVPDVRGEERVVQRREVTNVQTAPPNTEGATAIADPDGGSRGDEPRYTAAEWAELQRRQ